MSSFSPPPFAAVVEGDALWGLESSRRRLALQATRDDSDPYWLLSVADYCHISGEYKQAIGYTDRAISLADGCAQIRARALYIQCMCCLSIALGERADHAARDLATLADSVADPLVRALADLTWAINSEKNVFLAELGPDEQEKPATLRLLDDAATTLTQLGEYDAAIRAKLEYALVKNSLGKYLTAIETIETAAHLAREHNCWTLGGRFPLVVAMAATDQGYRLGVEKTLREAIAICGYLGDVWGRNEAWIAMGRLLAYEMPAGRPELTEGPDRYLRLAVKEAEALGLTWMVAGIDNTRAWVFRKAGDEDRSRHLLGEDVEEKGLREKLASESTVVAERIMDDIKRKNASRLHDGVEDSVDAFFVFDALRNEDGVCRDYVSPYANRAAFRLLGREPGGHVCLYSEAQIVPQLRGLEDALELAVQDRRSSQDICEVRPGVWVERRIVPSGDGAVLTVRDVSAEKQIESALRRSAESAERSERAKSVFLANMSHEIRTPLNGVLGLARMLVETDLNETQRGYVDDIVLSGDLLLDLIGDILDISKIESQEMRLSVAPVSLTHIVYGIVKLFRGQAQEKSTVLSFQIEPEVPETVVADGVRLRQILANLVGNAVKFTERGEVGVYVSRDHDLIVFEVRDTGVGIAPERLDAIFDRFQQADTLSIGGTGLGLTISKALTELMGGEMRVVSTVGEGSSFFVRLPLREAHESPPSPQAEPSRRFDGRRILLVDDNRVNVLVSAHALRKLGCEVVCAEDGRKALAALAREPFDLVFMDVRMPVLDGLEATRKLRETHPDLPVIALTAGALLHEQRECFEAGMNDFASKPFTSDSIYEVLAKWLPA